MGKYEGKRLLVLGGMKLLREAILYAQSEGARVFVTDYFEDSPAKRYADQSFMVSATDIEGLSRLCEEEKIDGIFTGYADVLLPYYAKLCSKTGLPCYGTYENFCTMTDKRKFKDLCFQYGVPAISEFTVEEARNNPDIYPLLIKPVDASGSKGITICKNVSEFEVGLMKALEYSRSKRCLVEKYMTGPEVVLYYYFQDGNPVFQGMCDRYVERQGEQTAQLPTAYIYPSKYTKSHMNQNNQKIIDMFRAIKMQNGPIFLQGFVDEAGVPVLYEPGYRLCGAREHCIVSEINGVDSEKMLINLAFTGKMCEEDLEKVSDPLFHGKIGCKLSPLICAGKVARIEGLDEIIKMETVRKIFLNNDVGDEVTAEDIGTLKQLAFRAYIVENSAEELKETIDRIQNCIEYYDVDGNPMIIKMFDTRLLDDYRSLQK